MKSSGLLDDFQLVENRGCGYNRTPVGYLHAKYAYAPNTYGASSLFSTVEDLFIWNRALRSGRVLPARWQEKMLTPYHNQGPNLKHAYSVDYHTISPPFAPESLEYISFDGALPGFITDAFVFQATDHTIILFDNSEEFNHTAMALGMYGILRGEAVDYPQPLAAQLIGEIAVKEGIDRACEVYQNLKRNQRKEYEFNSFKDILSDQGYLLADAGRMNEALAVFRLIVKINPNFPDAYNDLGRVYQRFGKADLSREAQQKAEELKAIVQQLYFSLSNGESAKAKATVEQMQTETPGDTLFESSSIGPIYADQLAKGKINESIQTCKVWALGNPEDVGPYFSLAIIYRKIGKRDEAKKCLEKVLLLDPAGRNAPVARMRMAELQSN
jgi:Flp pilus assembly protein TadD